MNGNGTVARTYGTMIGRMLLGLLFVFSGVGIVLNGTAGTAGMITSLGLPAAMLIAWLVVIIKVGAGAALMLGYRAQQAALALIVFVALATLFFHMDLEDINLFKNLSIMGGLLYVYAYGPGDGWKI